MISSSEYRECRGTRYVTFDMVRERDGEQAARRLMAWMRGQTVGIADNGDCMVYATDYQTWLVAGVIMD